MAATPLNAPNEATPLLSTPSPSPPTLPARRTVFSPFARLLLTCLICAISFVYTATPLVYSFRTVVCEIYYQEHPGGPGNGSGGRDRCAVREIEAGTAAAISLMAALSTFSGIANLLVTGAMIRIWGVKFAMINQTFWPCLRNLTQIFAIYHGGIMGLRILQWTQLITILGGGAGFFLSANTYVAALVTPEERTASFGIMQGIAMLGTAVGYTIGGLTGDIFGPPAPFEVTFCLLVISTLLSTFFLPFITPTTPTKSADTDSPTRGSIFSFLSPLRIFVPRKLDDGARYYGVLLLGLGGFLGVLALAYVPLLLQLTATNEFGFRPTENGYMMSANSAARAVFLTFGFPRIIKYGRKWYSSSSAPPKPTAPSETDIPTTAEAFEPLPPNSDATTEPTPPPEPTDKEHGSRFDLVFLRWSMVLDGVLTLGAAFMTKSWHVYGMACLIPLASGTAAASKGVVMEMVLPSQQNDALQAIALSETLATVLTVSLFGMVFAWLSELGKAQWTFGLNAGLAMVAAAVLAFARFPRTKLADGV